MTFNPNQLRDDHGRWGYDDNHTVDSLAKISIRSPFSSEEKSALKQYSMRSSPVNNSLRRNLVADPNVARQIRYMDSAFTKAALPEERAVYRVINQKYYDDALAKNIGKEMMDKGFLSTTVNEDGAGEVLFWLSSKELPPGVPEPKFKTLRLIVPKQYPAIPMTDDTSASRLEDNEVLLKRGTRFKLLDSRTIKVLD